MLPSSPYRRALKFNQRRDPANAMNTNDPTNNDQEDRTCHQFQPPMISRLSPPQHKPNTQHQTNSNDPIQIIGLNTSTFHAKTTKEKTQTVLADINLLLQDQVKPTQVYRAIDIIKNYDNDQINKMMTLTRSKSSCKDSTQH